jgi:hypothetical protein
VCSPHRGRGRWAWCGQVDWLLPGGQAAPSPDTGGYLTPSTTKKYRYALARITCNFSIGANSAKKGYF